MPDFRRILLTCIIAVLFAVFVFSFNSAVNSQPKYENYCRQDYLSAPKAIPLQPANCTPLSISPAEQQACTEKEGMIKEVQDAQGCPTSWSCDFCQRDNNRAQERYQWWQFIIAAAFGLAAILAGLMIPVQEGSLNETVSTGFLLGGLIALLFGTAFSYTAIYKWLRPIIILVELLIIIFIAYKKFRVKAKAI